MSKEASITFTGDSMQLEGVLDFANVVDLQEQGAAWLRDRAPASCRLDLGGVTGSNSAGTTLLLGWLRSAAAAGKHLSIENFPDSLRALMHLGGLDEVLADNEARRSR